MTNIQTEENMFTISGAYLSGKKHGLNARNELDIETLDKLDEVVQVAIEAKYATASFFLGLFTDSVAENGSDWFWSHYKIHANEFVYDALRDAVQFAANKKVSLSNH